VAASKSLRSATRRTKLPASRAQQRAESHSRQSFCSNDSNHDAANLGLEPDEMTYVTVGKLDGSSEKAIRDAGSISVTAI
jgi:hypothetical protein